MSKSETNEVAQIRASGLFSAQWYLKMYPDVAEAGIDPLTHYVKYGAKEGRRPNLFFDNYWYAHAYMNRSNDRNPLAHYIAVGATLGYRPDSSISEELINRFARRAKKDESVLAAILTTYDAISHSHLVDRDWYLAENGDVAEGGTDPVFHYLMYGCAEGRWPNRFFNPHWYVSTYPESANYQNVLMHYIKHGASCGYSTCPELLYFDIPGKHNQPRDPLFTPLGDFLRCWRLVENSYLLERDWYARRYKDIGAANCDPLFHYMVFGVGEGRNPNRFFDTKWYLSHYPEVADAGVNPLAHYIEIGAGIGYTPHPMFQQGVVATDDCVIAGRRVTPLEYFLNIVLPKAPQALHNFSEYDVSRLTEDARVERETPAYLRHIDVMIRRPCFAIYMDGTDAAKLAVTRESLSRQVYTQFVEVSDRRLSAANGPSHFLWLHAGDTIERNALYELASEINATPDVGLIYFDHDVALSGGGLRPVHKPQWSPDYLEAHNYIGRAACVSLADAADAVGEAACVYDLLLRVTEKELVIRHIDMVLLRADTPTSPAAEDEERRAIEGRLRRTGRRGVISANPVAPEHYIIGGALSRVPLVSIVIPTAGKIIDYRGRRVDLIGQCVSSICERSSYPNFEFVVVENGDLDRERLKVGETPITFVTYADREVNIARKINIGVASARGDYAIILNDDIAAISPDWIECMLRHFDKPHVGVVGARLLYPDNKLQHVGMVMCDGHLHHHVMSGHPASDPGYEYAAVTVRNYLSVTGAAMMVERKYYQELGGYIEVLPFDFNDVDFCLTARSLGRSIVYEPQAELYHYHAVSAERPPRPQDYEYFSKKWAKHSLDPYYNQRVFEKYQPDYQISYSERRI